MRCALGTPIPKYRVWATSTIRLTKLEKLCPAVAAAKTKLLGHTERRHSVDLQDKRLAEAVDPEVDAGAVPALAGTEGRNRNIPQDRRKLAPDLRRANAPRCLWQNAFRSRRSPAPPEVAPRVLRFPAVQRRFPAPFDVFFHERILRILRDNHFYGLPQLSRLMYELHSATVGFVTRLHYHWESQVAGTLGVRTHHAVIRRRHAAIADEPLSDHLVERQPMPERARSGVRDAGHLEHGRNVSETALALNSVRHVENDSRGAGLGAGWHEPFEPSEQSFIALAQQRLVAGLLQCRRHAFDRIAAEFLRTRLTEPVDYACMIIVPHDSYSHELLPGCLPRRQLHSRLVNVTMMRAANCRERAPDRFAFRIDWIVGSSFV